MRHNAFARDVTRDDLIAWHRRIRERTRGLFDLIVPDAYYDRPIALRNPIVFYEGHLPAFAVNTLVKLTLGCEGIDEQMETLFARGIDPETEAAAKSPTDVWPAREEVQRYAAAADALIEETLTNCEAAFTILEHELMHQETLLYMFHELDYSKKRLECGSKAAAFKAAALPPHSIKIPAGHATLGTKRGSQFGWDNEFPELVVDVPEFTIDAYNVTNGDYLEFVEATGAKPSHFWVRGEREWYWRGMFALTPLPLDAPVYVTHEQATAYARWKNARLPTEAEFHRAAYGTPSGEERLQPPGGNFDFATYDPIPVGSHPAGASAWGLHDLVGNGWEWTSSVFAGFPGFEPMPSYLLYSTDFFDNAHFVLKGASPATANELVRRSFRNWFRPNYPFVYATFRCVN